MYVTVAAVLGLVDDVLVGVDEVAAGEEGLLDVAGVEEGVEEVYSND